MCILRETTITKKTAAASPIRDQDLAALKDLVLTSPKSFLEKAHYHGASHSQDVVENVKILSELLGLPKRDSQILQIAALFHDFEHAAYPYKQLVDHGKRSNEEHAVHRAAQILRDLDPASDPTLGLTKEERREIYKLILATSFGQSEGVIRGRLDVVLGKPESHTQMAQRESLIHRFQLVRPYQPETVRELMLCVADVGAFMKSPEHHLLGGLKFNQENGVDLEIDKFIDEQKKFVKFYLEPLVDRCKKAVHASPEFSEAVEPLTAFLHSRLKALNEYLNRSDLPAEVSRLHSTLAS